MQVSPKVHTALATVLLILSLVRLELSRRAARGISHLALDLAVSVPKDVLLVVYVGLSWAEISEAVREVILGISSVFPFLLVVRASEILFLDPKLTTQHQSLRMSILLRSLTGTPSRLVICFSLFFLSSSLIKITATLVGIYIYLPLQHAVLFLHFVDYLSLAYLLWSLDEYTTAGSRTGLQLRCALHWTMGLAAVLLLIAVFGVVLYCWLLSLEVRLAAHEEIPLLADFDSCNYTF